MAKPEATISGRDGKHLGVPEDALEELLEGVPEEMASEGRWGLKPERTGEEEEGEKETAEEQNGQQIHREGPGSFADLSSS